MYVPALFKQEDVTVLHDTIRTTGVTAYPQPAGVVEILERRGFQVDQHAAKIKGNIHFEEYW